MAATNKCSARSNKTRHVSDARSEHRRGRADRARDGADPGRQQKRDGKPMKKTILMAAVTIALATTAAEAEIICTHSGGCYETGMKIIYGDGGGVTSSMQSLNSYRTGEKVKVQIRRSITVD